MNWQTVVVALIVAAIFISIIVKGIINRKNGKSSCSCGCENCGMKDSCHSTKK